MGAVPGRAAFLRWVAVTGGQATHTAARAPRDRARSPPLVTQYRGIVRKHSGERTIDLLLDIMGPSWHSWNLHWDVGDFGG